MNIHTGKPVHSACIIEDDRINNLIIEKMLSLHNIANPSLSFPNGKEALDYLTLVKAFPEQLPDIIFLDINMPIMDGWQFLNHFEKIKSQFAKPISIYVLSASIDTPDIEKAKSYSIVSDYLIKPVTKEDLARVLEEVQNLQEKN
jgi:CheY-like chemotaxis protein